MEDTAGTQKLAITSNQKHAVGTGRGRLSPGWDIKAGPQNLEITWQEREGSTAYQDRGSSLGNGRDLGVEKDSEVREALA